MELFSLSQDPWVRHSRRSPSCDYLIETRGTDFIQTIMDSVEKVLYHTVPYRTVMYHTVPYRYVPYRTIYHTVPYRTLSR